MRLGIVVSTRRHLKVFVNLALTAARQGHRVSVFVTGEGVELLPEKEIAELAANDMIEMVFCEFISKKIGIAPDSIPDSFKAGSQLDNALMMRDSDRVISL